MRCARLSLDPGLAQWPWVIVGHHRAYGELAERLRRDGCDARWHPAFTRAVQQEILERAGVRRIQAHDAFTLAQTLRDLYAEMALYSRRVHLARWGSEAAQRIEAMASRKRRKALWGTSSMRRIAELVGLELQGDWIVGGAPTTDNRCPGRSE